MGDDEPGTILLTTRRLHLRRPVIADAAMHRRLWEERDPRVPPHRRLSSDERPTVGDLEARLREESGSPTGGLLTIIDRDSQRAIGYCGVIPASATVGHGDELAYELVQSAWGRGFATEAAAGILARSRELGQTRMHATIRDWNHASRRVVAKLGFVRLGPPMPDPEHGDSLLYVKQPL